MMISFQKDCGKYIKVVKETQEGSINPTSLYKVFFWRNHCFVDTTCTNSGFI